MSCYVPYRYDSVVYAVIAAAGLVLGIAVAAVGVRGSWRVRQVVCGVLRVVAATWILATAYTWHVLARQAAEKAHIIACQQHLRLLGEAMLRYTEARGSFPPAAGWDRAIIPYLPEGTSEAVFQCPDARTRYGYAYNASLGGVHLDRVGAPALVVLVAEYDTNRRDAVVSMAHVAWGRHLGRVNLLMADGHISSQTRTGAADLRWTP